MKANAPTYFLGEDFPARLSVFVEQFLTRGCDYFSEEFAKIDDYVERAIRDDSAQTLRRTQKAEYLLELVAFKIYDELDREAFNRTKSTLIVMPDCLSLHNRDCEKIETLYGTVCHRCQENCQAYQIGEVARRYRVRTIFSKRKLSRQLHRYADRMGDLGVIGVACIKMLASGMRTAREEGIPARGVLLDFSGCEHWNDKPCASEFSIKWLESILEEKHGRQHQATDH